MKRRSVTFRLLRAILFVLVTVLLLYSAYSAYTFSSVLQQQVIENATQTVEQASAYVRYQQEDVRQFASQILVDESIKKQLVSGDKTPSVMDYYKLAGTLAEYMTMRNYVVRILVVSAENAVFSSQRTYDPNIPLDGAWRADFLARGLPAGFTNRHLVDTGRSGDRDVITYVSPFYSFTNREERIGQLFIDIDTTYFTKTIAQAVSQFEWFIWRGGDGTVLYSEGEGWGDFVTATESGTTAKGDGVRITGGEMSDGWTFCAALRQDDIRSATAFVVWFFLATAAVAMIAIGLILMPVILRLIRPVKQLTLAAQSISEGQFDVRVTVKTGDEMQTLSEAFNLMAQNLSLQMAQIVEHEKSKNNLKMEMLLSQINPHFIYNTLNSVIYLATEGKNQDVAELTRIFIRILQDNLKLGVDGSFGTVREEVACVKDYLYLQQYRYPDRFVLKLDVEDALWDEMLPRLLLQPLVENALFHGILPQEEPGLIVISIRRNGHETEILVKDNGVGMDLSKAQELLEKPSPISAAMRSIGVANVRERLMLFYGDRGSFSIESQIDIGTTIRITLPLDIKA